MPIIITSPNAIEESTYVVTVSFEDEEGNAVAPNEAFWTLTDTSGNVINSRNEVEIESPETSENIVLSGDDLVTESGADTRRILTIEGTYDSSNGTGLPFKEQATFLIKNLTKSSLR